MANIVRLSENALGKLPAQSIHNLQSLPSDPNELSTKIIAALVRSGIISKVIAGDAELKEVCQARRLETCELMALKTMTNWLKNDKPQGEIWQYFLEGANYYNFIPSELLNFFDFLTIKASSLISSMDFLNDSSKCELKKNLLCSAEYLKYLTLSNPQLAEAKNNSIQNCLKELNSLIEKFHKKVNRTSDKKAVKKSSAVAEFTKIVNYLLKGVRDKNLLPILLSIMQYQSHIKIKHCTFNISNNPENSTPDCANTFFENLASEVSWGIKTFANQLETQINKSKHKQESANALLKQIKNICDKIDELNTIIKDLKKPNNHNDLTESFTSVCNLYDQINSYNLFNEDCTLNNDWKILVCMPFSLFSKSKDVCCYINHSNSPLINKEVEEKQHELNEFLNNNGSFCKSNYYKKYESILNKVRLLVRQSFPENLDEANSVEVLKLLFRIDNINNLFFIFFKPLISTKCTTTNLECINDFLSFSQQLNSELRKLLNTLNTSINNHETLEKINNIVNLLFLDFKTIDSHVKYLPSLFTSGNETKPDIQNFNEELNVSKFILNTLIIKLSYTQTANSSFDQSAYFSNIQSTDNAIISQEIICDLKNRLIAFKEELHNLSSNNDVDFLKIANSLKKHCQQLIGYILNFSNFHGLENNAIHEIICILGTSVFLPELPLIRWASNNQPKLPGKENKSFAKDFSKAAAEPCIKAQYFDFHSIESEHLQKEKTTTAPKDSGVQDCAFLPASTAVFRMNTPDAVAGREPLLAIEGIAKLQFGDKSALFVQDPSLSQIAYPKSSMSICAETGPAQKSSNLASKASFAIPSIKNNDDLAQSDSTEHFYKKSLSNFINWHERIYHEDKKNNEQLKNIFFYIESLNELDARENDPPVWAFAYAKWLFLCGALIVEQTLKFYVKKATSGDLSTELKNTHSICSLLDRIPNSSQFINENDFYHLNDLSSFVTTGSRSLRNNANPQISLLKRLQNLENTADVQQALNEARHNIAKAFDILVNFYYNYFATSKASQKTGFPIYLSADESNALCSNTKEIAKPQFGAKSAFFVQDPSLSQIAYPKSNMSICAETGSAQKSSNLASKASFAIPSTDCYKSDKNFIDKITKSTNLIHNSLINCAKPCETKSDLHIFNSLSKRFSFIHKSLAEIESSKRMIEEITTPLFQPEMACVFSHAILFQSCLIFEQSIKLVMAMHEIHATSDNTEHFLWDKNPKNNRIYLHEHGINYLFDVLQVHLKSIDKNFTLTADQAATINYLNEFGGNHRYLASRTNDTLAETFQTLSFLSCYYRNFDDNWSSKSNSDMLTRIFKCCIKNINKNEIIKKIKSLQENEIFPHAVNLLDGAAAILEHQTSIML